MEKVHVKDHDLYKLIASLKTAEDCNSFFEDLCTPKELISLEQRLDLAMYLEQGLPYLEIMARTGASSATISRVRRFMLEHGNGGVIKDILEENGLNVAPPKDTSP